MLGDDARRDRGVGAEMVRLNEPRCERANEETPGRISWEGCCVLPSCWRRFLFTGKPALQPPPPSLLPLHSPFFSFFLLRGECSTGTPLFAAMTQSPELPGLADVFRLA